MCAILYHTWPWLTSSSIHQWPYTYDACDVGTLKNQTLNGLPIAATRDNDKGNGGALSFLPGQRLSRCTCPGESHPGPVHENGEYVGRSAPEIDVFEAQVCLQHPSRSSELTRLSSVDWWCRRRKGWCGLTVWTMGGMYPQMLVLTSAVRDSHRPPAFQLPIHLD